VVLTHGDVLWEEPTIGFNKYVDSIFMVEVLWFMTLEPVEVVIDVSEDNTASIFRTVGYDTSGYYIERLH
jgi:hypothetical protein